MFYEKQVEVQIHNEREKEVISESGPMATAISQDRGENNRNIHTTLTHI